MASEAEYERLYQLWVRNGGGALTLVGTDTPVEYYNARTAIDLTPAQLAELQARQAHYNRTQALQTISSEIGANNFTNPYDARSAASIAQFNTFGASPGVLAVTGLSSSFSGISPDSSISPGTVALVAALGGRGVLIAALSSALGLDLDKVLGIAALGVLGASAFGALQNHTNSQMTDLPDTLDKASALAGMSAQFGEVTDSCGLFNELMGLLSGAFDGVMDFVDAGMDKLNGLMDSALGAIGDIALAITGALAAAIAPLIAAGMAIADAVASLIANGIDSVLDTIKGAVMDLLPAGVTDLLGEIGNLADSLKGAVSDIANQVASEIAGILDMAADLAAKLKALAMAASMLDPCQFLVLMNVGSDALKSAAADIVSPVTDVVDEIQTELDPRADAAEVTAAVEQAKQTADAAAGVPQSPMTNAARLYSPSSAYLHDLQTVPTNKFQSEDTFESVKTDTGTKVTKVAETGSESDEEGVTTYTPSTFEANIYSQWKIEHLNNLMQLKRRVGKLNNQARKALKNGTFRNDGVKDSVEDMKYEFSEISIEIKDLMTKAKDGLSYHSKTGKRDPALEEEKENEYKSIWGPRANEGTRRLTRDVADLESTWASYQSLIIM